MCSYLTSFLSLNQVYRKTLVKLSDTLTVTDDLLKESVDKKLLTKDEVEAIEKRSNSHGRRGTTTDFLDQIPKGSATMYNLFKQVLRKAAESSSEIEQALKYLVEKENEVLPETIGKQ